MLALKILYKLVLSITSAIAVFWVVTIIWPSRSPEILGSGLASLWFVALVSFEIAQVAYKRPRSPKILTHLRFGSITVAISSIVIILCFNSAMIEYSKYEIRSYVYGSASPQQEVDLKLFTDYKGWCGNGYSAREYELYADTAAGGYSSPDADVRARSLRASLEVFDWLNGVSDGPFPELIKEAQYDEDPVVQGIVNEFLEANPSYRVVSSKF